MASPIRFLGSVIQSNPFAAIASGAHAKAAAAPEAVRIFGITLIGATPHNLHKLILTAAFIGIAFVVGWIIRTVLKLFIGSRSGTRFQFWARQGVSLVIGAILLLGIMSIWFDSPARLAGFLGLVGAGLAFALQRVITAVGLFRHPSRQDLQRRRSHRHGRGPRRRHRPQLHADPDHGDGPAARDQ